MNRILLFTFLFLLSGKTNAQLFINEVMSNNQNFITDNDGDYSDWIEIYNGGSLSVNLNGYYLTDRLDSLEKWRIPSITLPANSTTVIWCSGKNLTGIYKHTNFSIDSQGETIYLSDPGSNVVDDFAIPVLTADLTYGRFPDGSSNIVYLSAPTFNQSNNTASALSGIIHEAPDFNIHGGFYISPQLVNISHPDPSVTIHYTLDGSDPTENSPVYSTSILVQSRTGDSNYYSQIRTCYNVHAFLPDWYPPVSEVFKCTVIRARALKNGFVPGPIQTYSYFIDPFIHIRYGNLPVVSIVSDPKNLFNDTTGIYVPGINYVPGTYNANYYKNWNRPSNIEMYMPTGLGAFNGNFKVNINGQSSPSSPQKGFNVNSSTDYGPSKIDYPLFINTNGKARFIQKFDKIKFRAWGSDRNFALFRDAYCSTFMTKSDLDIEAYQPVVVFIDGEYWGIQEMRERNRNAEYYQSHFMIDKKNPGVDILDGAGNTVIEGDAVHWNAMINYINHNALNQPSHYNYVKTQMDVNSFMLSYMSSMYFARGDWPDQNEGKWRPHTPSGRWRWMQWDMDNTVAYYLAPWYDMFNLAIHGSRGLGPSDLLVDLMKSTEFKYNFINLFADYMNTEFLPPLAQARVDQLVAQLQPYFSEYQDRWQVNYNWQNQTDSMKWWMGLRPQFVKQQILNNFNLNAVRNLQLNVSDTVKGNIKVNTVFLDSNTARITANTYPWTGQYFEGVPIPLKAIAKPGYRFVAWLPTNDTNQTISVHLTRDTSLTALFDVDPNYYPFVWPVINEVMTSNDSTISDNYGQYDDWVEIYNPNNDTIDLAGYYLTNNLVLPSYFQIATGSDSTKIPPFGFKLIWMDKDTDQGILHASFKLSSSGDFIALIAPNGETVADSVSIHSLVHDISYGRMYDASPLFIDFPVSTPNASNAPVITPENIYINELQTMNLSVVADNYGEYNPWIELYNPNSDTVDLAGWRITNDVSGIPSYTFPAGNDSTKISPLGFKLIWPDSDVNQGILHLNFSLQQTSCIRLYKPFNIPVDSVCYTSIGVNQSYGRINDGNPLWMNFSIPTPDSNNVDQSVGIRSPESQTNFYAYPNPVHDGMIYFNKPVSFSLYDVIGRQLVFADKRRYFDMSAFEQGVYFIRTTKGEIFKLVKD